MPNLINTDSAGNVFYNYITPVIKGETRNGNTSGYLDGFLEAKLGTKGISWNSTSTGYNVRLPAPGFESKTGNVVAGSDLTGNDRMFFNTINTRAVVNSSNSASSASYAVGQTVSSLVATGDTEVAFAVINDYSIVYCRFGNPSFSYISKFFYLGWLRESSYTGTSAGVLGLTCLSSSQTSQNVQVHRRPLAANSESSVTLASAADSITSPPIVCTTGTDPGDGSETFTDIVIRDAASPNNPVGKLWNCIDMPATCNVGELWRNTGAYDGDASASEQDIYLCVMPWGTRKLGMRVWTENIT